MKYKKYSIKAPYYFNCLNVEFLAIRLMFWYHFFYLIVSTFPGSSATRALIRFPQMNGASCSLTSPHFCFDIILFGFPVKVNNSVSMCLNRQEEREKGQWTENHEWCLRKLLANWGDVGIFVISKSFTLAQLGCGESRRLHSKMVILNPSDNKKWTSVCFPDRAGRN